MADVEGQQDHDAATRVQAIQRGRIARRNAKDDDNTRAVSKDGDEYAGETARLHTLEDVHAENANFAWVSRAVALAFLTIPMVVVFFTFFAEIGYGHEVYRGIATQSHLARPIQLACAAVMLLLYIIDVSYWEKGASRILRALIVALLIIALGTSAVLSFKTKPYLPLAVFCCLMPLYFVVLKKNIWPTLHTSNFMMVLGAVMVVAGSICLLVAAVWVHKHNFWWTHRTQKHFTCLLTIGQSGEANSLCEMPSDDNLTDAHYGSRPGAACGDETLEDGECQAAFVLWGGQFMASSLMILLGLMSGIIGYSQRKTVDDVDAMSPTHKMFFYLVVLGCMGVWIAAQIGGTEIQLAQLVTVFSGMLILFTVGIMVVTVGHANISKSMDEIPMMAKMESAGSSSLMRAILLMVVVPILPVILLLSFLNQMVRRSPFPFTKKLDGDSGYWLTQPVHDKLADMRHWKWSRILVNCIWISFAYLCLSVGGGKYTYVALGSLSEALASTGLVFTTIFFFLIGLLMFMAPPIPGPPIYLTGGIVVVRSAEVSFSSAPAVDSGLNGTGVAVASDDYTPFVLGVVYACFLCVFLKLTAAACQQKLIGQALSNRVGVRKMVGVNSVSVQAIKRVLQTPGLNYSKVMILIGGPDWPTSVLAGILGTNVWQMMLGTLPIFPVVSLCVTAGAFQLKKDGPPGCAMDPNCVVDPTWGALSSVFLTLATVTGTFCLTMAGVEIESFASTHRISIEEDIRVNGDEEVRKLEEQEEILRQKEKYATAWVKVPLGLKLALVLGALCADASLIIWVAYGSRCFVPYTVTTPFSGPPLHGNLAKMVKPGLGHISIALHFVALLCLIAFKVWSSKQVKPDVSMRDLTRLGDGVVEETQNPAHRKGDESVRSEMDDAGSEELLTPRDRQASRGGASQDET